MFFFSHIIVSQCQWRTPIADEDQMWQIKVKNAIFGGWINIMKLAGSEGDKAKITEADFRPVLVVQPVKVKTHLFQQQYVLLSLISWGKIKTKIFAIS